MQHQTDENLIKLARVIYELILDEEDKEMLGKIDGIALEAKIIFDNRDNTAETLHPDLGFNVAELNIFKIEAAEAMYKEYKDLTRETIEHLEKAYDIPYHRPSEPHSTEKNLIRLARILYDLILHEEDKKILIDLKNLTNEAKTVFDAHTTTKGTLPPGLGAAMLRFASLKADGNQAYKEYKDRTVKLIQALEQEYGVSKN